MVDSRTNYSKDISNLIRGPPAGWKAEVFKTEIPALSVQRKSAQREQYLQA
jgi:hypothetical protein